jgi:ribosomal protein S27E
MGAPRYRCDGCGNLTRFDVTTTRRTTAFHHYTVGGELRVEEETVLSHHVDGVSCRWCGHGHSVVELAESETGGSDVDGAGEQEHQEPGAASRVT